MKKISYTEAKELAKSGVETSCHPSLWALPEGLVCDKSYQLPDGSILDLTCLNGWIYEGRLFSKEEALEKEFGRMPQNAYQEF
jgi:hypothetical protein